MPVKEEVKVEAKESIVGEEARLSRMRERGLIGG